MSIPYFAPGSTLIGKYQYKDPGFLHTQLKEYFQTILDSNATDIFVIANNKTQKQIIESMKGDSDRVFFIEPGESETPRMLENKKSIVKQAAEGMRIKAVSLFS